MSINSRRKVCDMVSVFDANFIVVLGLMTKSITAIIVIYNLYIKDFIVVTH